MLLKMRILASQQDSCPILRSQYLVTVPHCPVASVGFCTSSPASTAASYNSCAALGYKHGNRAALSCCTDPPSIRVILTYRATVIEVQCRWRRPMNMAFFSSVCRMDVVFFCPKSILSNRISVYAMK